MKNLNVKNFIDFNELTIKSLSPIMSIIMGRYLGFHIYVSKEWLRIYKKKFHIVKKSLVSRTDDTKIYQIIISQEKMNYDELRTDIQLSNQLLITSAKQI